MKNVLTTKLLELLIKFDFLFLESNKNSKLKTRYSNKNVELKTLLGKKSYYILNPSELIKSLKRIFRLFQFFSKQEEFTTTFNFKSEYHLELFKNIILLEKLDKKNILIEKTIFFNPKKQSGAYIFFDSKNSASLYEKLFKNNKHISIELNNKQDLNDFGTYKFFSDFKDWKKIIFLVLLIKQVYNKD